jgi:hypothetical protein
MDVSILKIIVEIPTIVMFKICQLHNKIKIFVLQYSKVIKSRSDWKRKATKRADKIRQYRKAKKRDLEIIAKLNAKIAWLEQSEDGKKNS